MELNKFMSIKTSKHSINLLEGTKENTLALEFRKLLRNWTAVHFVKHLTMSLNSKIVYHTSDHTSSESVAIYFHQEPSFVLNTSSVLCESWQWSNIRKTSYCC